jgi:hypothetical protein
MGVGRCFAADRAQAEAVVNVETGGAQLAVIEHEVLGLAIFEKQLAVIGVGQRALGQRNGAIAGQVGTGVEQVVGRWLAGHGADASRLVEW